MEMPWQNWLSHTGKEDGDFFNQRFDDEELVIREILHQSAFSSESESHSPPTQNNYAAAADGGCGGTTTVSNFSFDDAVFLNGRRGNLLTKSNSSNSIVSQFAPEKPAATDTSQKANILSFDDSTVVAATSHAYGRKQPKHEKVDSGGARSSKGAAENHNSGPRANQTTKKSRVSSESLDHIMAERKRRQELTERFIALSATIPGLKKIDKATILSEAITYVKQLQERVRELEEQSKRIRVESVSFVEKSHLYTDEVSASCEMNSDDCYRPNVAHPEVEARVLEKEVLIRIHCKKQNGIVLKILAHLKSLDLSMVSNSVLPFGNSTLDITIVSQMSDKYNLDVKDLVKNLRLALLESPDVQQ